MTRTVKEYPMSAKNDFIWAYMLKIGTNMWSDTVPPKWSHYKPEEVHCKKAADHVRCDETIWRDMTDKAAALKGRSTLQNPS